MPDDDRDGRQLQVRSGMSTCVISVVQLKGREDRFSAWWATAVIEVERSGISGEKRDNERNADTHSLQIIFVCL